MSVKGQGLMKSFYKASLHLRGLNCWIIIILAIPGPTRGILGFILTKRNCLLLTESDLGDLARGDIFSLYTFNILFFTKSLCECFINLPHLHQSTLHRKKNPSSHEKSHLTEVNKIDLISYLHYINICK